MKQKTTIGQVIIVLSEHPVLGVLLIPYIAERQDNETVCLIEQAFHASPEAVSRLTQNARQLTSLHIIQKST